MVSLEYIVHKVIYHLNLSLYYFQIYLHIIVESIYIGIYRGDVGFKVGEVLSKERICGSCVN